MKLTKRALRKLIKEEFKTSRLKEDNDEEIEDIGGGELSPSDLGILRQLQKRFMDLAGGTDPSGKDVELKDFVVQLDALIKKVERLAGVEGGKIDRSTRMSTGVATQRGVETARSLSDLNK